MLINTHDRTLGRQRATAAHELGHFEEDGDAEFAEAIDVAKPAEGFADGFAIEMLMPEAGVKDWAQANITGELTAGDVARAAAYFVTSYRFAVIRFQELRLAKKPRATQLIEVGAKRAAFAGGVTEWYETGQQAINKKELPASYLSNARSAYTASLVTLPRLAELEFDSTVNVRRRLREQGLLGEAEGTAEEETPVTASAPEAR
jgi:Zn-dependent peptidase ImmA (M78 family)